jgi:hypothetical protein
MWQKTTHTQQSALNRRPFLRNILGLGAAVAAHPFVDGANSNPNCAEGEISAADSLFLYTKLLDRVSSAAYHLMVDEEAFDFQDCSKLLEQFAQKLRELREQLCGTSSAGRSKSEERFDAARKDVESLRVSLVSVSRSGDPQSVADMVAQGMGRCVGKLLPDGEITLNQKARQILSDMLTLVDKQQAVAAKAAAQHLHLDTDWQKMDNKFVTMQSDLFSAVRDILEAEASRAGSGKRESALKRADGKIGKIMRQNHKDKQHAEDDPFTVRRVQSFGHFNREVEQLFDFHRLAIDQML